MANVCEICAKGERAGMNVSHSHLKTKRTWKPVLLLTVKLNVLMFALAACVLVKSNVLNGLRTL